MGPPCYAAQHDVNADSDFYFCDLVERLFPRENGPGTLTSPLPDGFEDAPSWSDDPRLSCLEETRILQDHGQTARLAGSPGRFKYLFDKCL